MLRGIMIFFGPRNSCRERMKIDEWLPEYQVSARYSILVPSSVETVAAALRKASFADLPVVRRLMRLRGYRLGKTEPEASPATVGFGSFLELVATPEEVVLGIAGHFWRPDGGIVRDLTPQEFPNFRRAGYAKAVWNFHLSPVSGGAQLSTQTRVQTFGRAATVKFRMYWLVVGPLSGLMRKAMLREVKRLAEQAQA
jgi:hypothetical protein